MIYFSNDANVTVWSGHVGTGKIDSLCNHVYYAQADGDELAQALKIVGRESAPFRVFTFVGDEAKQIFMNWR